VQRDGIHHRTARDDHWFEKAASMSLTGVFRLRLAHDFQVPAKVHSHEEFAETILSLWRFASEKMPSLDEEFAFLCSMYYLLGWMVGDAGKGMGSRRRHTVRIRYELSKKHPENLELGNYVKQVIQNLGVWCERMADGPARRHKPLESYYWDSHYSPIFGWMFTACLGSNGTNGRHTIMSSWTGCLPRPRA